MPRLYFRDPADSVLKPLDGGPVGTGATPIGGIMMFGSGVAPPGWHLCDGSTHGSAALQSVIGTSTTPDLRDRFIVGAGSTYALKDVGGAAAVTLTGAQSGTSAHTHTASTAGETQEHVHGVDMPYGETGTVSSDHAHGFGTGYMNQSNPHAHDGYTKEGITTGDSDTWIDTADADGTARWNTMEISAIDINHTHSGGTGGIDRNHVHGIDFGAINSGGRSAVHTHTVTVNASTEAAATQSHENRPPYYALTFIIRKS